MPDNAIRLRSDDVTWTATGDEVVILDLRTSQYLQLNDSAASLWQRLSVGGATLSDLTDHLVQTYGIDSNEAAADARAFVTDLTTRDLVHTS